MNQRFLRNVVLAAVLFRSAFGADTIPRITVQLYNYASLSPRTLVTVERGVGGILQKTGIHVDWVVYQQAVNAMDRDSLHRPAGSPARIDIRLLPQQMTGRLSVSPEVFGRAMLAKRGELGTYADVFAEAANQLCARWGWPHGPILSAIVAHELGHLFLWNDFHSPSGLMKKAWSMRELHDALQGSLLFTQAQAEQIRAQAVARTEIADCLSSNKERGDETAPAVLLATRPPAVSNCYSSRTAGRDLVSFGGLGRPSR